MATRGGQQSSVRPGHPPPIGTATAQLTGPTASVTDTQTQLQLARDTVKECSRRESSTFETFSRTQVSSQVVAFMPVRGFSSDS